MLEHLRTVPLGSQRLAALMKVILHPLRFLVAKASI
jgi:hypothetical protein